MLKIDLEYSKGILLVRFLGKLERKYTYKINNNIIPALKKHNIKYLIYNFKELDDIDEAGINSILLSKVTLKENQGHILLCEVNDKLSNKIKMLNIKITSSESSAIRKLEVLM